MYGPSSYRMLYLRVRITKRLLAGWAYGGKEEKLEFVLLPAGTGNSGRLNINCKAITLEIYSYLIKFFSKNSSNFKLYLLERKKIFKLNSLFYIGSKQLQISKMKT
ncbi:hypothetical protein CFP56_011455 [Quercus suber]|uniref:Uncharacterized protein n=1 Tax=Quercus suber TaxID=58331 RepID=A0AAW0M6T5_QUESU